MCIYLSSQLGNNSDMIATLYWCIVRIIPVLLRNGCPHLVKYINAIEGVQRRATKMIPTLKNFAYPERLKKLKLPTLAYKRACEGHD